MILCFTGVLILDGSSEHDAHTWSKPGISIYKGIRLHRSTESLSPVLLRTCAACSELPSNVPGVSLSSIKYLTGTLYRAACHSQGRNRIFHREGGILIRRVVLVGYWEAYEMTFATAFFFAVFVIYYERPSVGPFVYNTFSFLLRNKASSKDIIKYKNVSW